MQASAACSRRMEIRFGVESADGKYRSSTWKVWSGGPDDVFVVCRDISGAVKASFHRSGHWHLAFDKNVVNTTFPKDSPARTDRFFLRWMHELDASIATLSLRILLHAGSITIPQDQPRKHDVRWLPAPPPEQCVVVAVIFAPAEWSPSGSAVGHFDLKNGPRVWVRYGHGQAPPSQTWRVSALHPLSPNASQTIAAGEGLRILIPGHDQLGALFFEGALQKG